MSRERSMPRPPRPPHDPNNMGAIELIHDIGRITHERTKRDCPEMQRSCRLIMMELAHEDNVTQLELVRRTYLKAPTVSVSLQKMERDGIVMRKQDEQDLRATRVFLTEKGRAMHNQIVSKIREQKKEAESCLSEEEMQTLVSLLTKIRNNLTGGMDNFEEEC